MDDVGIQIRRSELGRARGLGSAKAGVEHWWAERLTAIALVPLTVWFVVSVLRLLGADQPTVAHFIARPWNAALLILLVVMTFHHMQLGLQVIYEDYIHQRGTLVLSLATKAACLVLGLLAVLAVLKLAL
ncbi:MAG: succinate dehydrogenase, hydrophobic membrane anchor protein [Janthinobacterium lividum]